MPKVTVLLTSYNHADYLERSINSVLNQTYKDFELIIIDDCSTDDSWNIINKYKDKRIKKIRNKQNKGSILTEKLVNSFNGTYFAVAHCDDMWEPSKLEKQINFLEKNKKYAACFTWVSLIDENDNKISSDNYLDFNVTNKNRFEWLNYFFYNGNCLCHPSVMIRTDIQKSEKLYANGMASLPDFYRWVKLCLKHEIYVYPEELSYFRIRKAGMNTSGYNFNNITRISFEICNILELYKNLSKEDFIKVFPQSKKYKKGKYFNLLYSLGRICIDEIGSNNYRFFGLNCIYDVLKDVEELSNIKKIYNYTLKEFALETGSIDVFNVLNEKNINSSSIYFSADKNYIEENKISKKYLVKNNNHFDILYDNLNLKDANLRFDPDEGKFQKYSDVVIYVNGNKVNYNTNGKIINNDEIEFYNLDPQFEFYYKGVINNIYITGKCQVLNNSYALAAFQNDIKNQIEKKLINNMKSKRLTFKIKRIIRKIFKK